MAYEYPASLACQLRAAIRFWEELPYQTMAEIFKKEIPYNEKKHLCYMLGFFEECDCKLIKAFMLEQNITREQIIDIYSMLPEFGEISCFKDAIKNGEF